MRARHGMSHTREFSVWTDIQTRCHNPKSTSYPGYGARGIVVCERWRASFESFYADMGPRPSDKHSIDRIDTKGNYEPGNCRWATAAEQSINKRNNVLVTLNGVTKTLVEWCKERGVPRKSAWLRHKQGIRGEALFVPRCAHLTHAGITDTVRGWSKRTGIKASTIAMRINHYKWPVEKALTEGVSL